MADDTTFEILIGDTWWSPTTWGIVVDGAAVDLSDGMWTIRSQIRRRPHDAEVLHDFGAPGIVLGTADVEVGADTVTTSTVRLHIPAAITETFPQWSGAWDLELSHPTLGLGGTLWRRTIRSGTARTVRDVTR